MNRHERRAGMPEKVVDGPHECVDSLTRVSTLDWTKYDEEGVEPPIDFFGYECARCTRRWVQLHQRMAGQSRTSWRALDEIGEFSGEVQIQD